MYIAGCETRPTCLNYGSGKFFLISQVSLLHVGISIPCPLVGMLDYSTLFVGGVTDSVEVSLLGPAE